MTHIANTCLCVPEYVPGVRTMVKNPDIEACNFYEHATCVNYIYYYFDPIVAHCLPGCLEGTYEKSNLQVFFKNIESKLKKLIDF